MIHKGRLGDGLVQVGQLLAQEPQLAEARRHRLSFVFWELDALEPAKPLHAEEVRGRRAVDEIAMEHGM